VGHNIMKSLDKSKYTSPPRIQPKDKATQELYYQIYQDYTMMHMTEKQITDKYGYSDISTVSHIIKWVVFQIDELDSNSNVQIMIDKSKMRQQEIEACLMDIKSAKVKVQLWGELRRIDMFIAKLQGLMSNALVDIDNSKNIIVMNNPNLERRGQLNANRDVEKDTIDIIPED